MYVLYHLDKNTVLWPKSSNSFMEDKKIANYILICILQYLKIK